MEIVFLVISILISVSAAYLLGRTMYSHKGLIRTYKTSEFLFMYHMILVIFMIMTIFVTLCAFNNTFWMLPYLSQ